MNKFLLTSVALAVAAVCGSASAADVKISGKIDTGFNYLVERATIDGAVDKNEKTFQMASSQRETSSFAIKGSEDLGNGWKVGFVLDSDVHSDDGALDDGRLFKRAAMIYVVGPYGEIGMGRYGLLDSGNGRYGLLDEDVTPLATGWDEIGDTKTIFLGQKTRTDNVLTYRSPKFAGTQVTIQYSGKMDAVESKKNYYHDAPEGTSDSNRYYGIGVKTELGNFIGVATASLVDYSCEAKAFANTDKDKDGKTFTLAGGYDFGPARLLAGAQYFDTGLAWSKYSTDDYSFKPYQNGKGYGVFLGTQAKISKGTLFGIVGYTDAETVGDYDKSNKRNIKIGDDIKIQQFCIGYDYPLSKRTKVYAAAGYNKKEVGQHYTEQLTEVMFGLATKF